MTDLNWAALLPLLLLGVGLVVYALVDIRSHEVKAPSQVGLDVDLRVLDPDGDHPVFPRWTW